MKRLSLKPVCAAIGLALAVPAFAASIDFGGSNIYMKFLDGDQRKVSLNSGDTSNGTDNGQWTEFELRIKAVISKQVEAFVRLQSRSPAAYWTDFGGFGGAETSPTRGNFIKLRGAYVLLTPGYKWLDTALIGSSDWGMFDPFTVGQVRYIDRENYKGFYFKGPLPMAGASWEFGRLSLPNYLQANWGNLEGNCCTPDDLQNNEAVYIAQLKAQLGPAKLTTSYQWFNDRKLAADTTPNDGQDIATRAKSTVFMIKGEGSAMDVVDLKGAFYHSTWKSALFNEPWGNSPKSDVNGNALVLNAALTSLPVPGLSVNYQYFNVGAGFYSNTASRRDADVLLTEGSEAAWFRWGDPIWLGGAAKDYTQSPIRTLADNDNMDFDEAPTEGINGSKGHTFLVNYEIAKTPLSFEYTNIDYNYNWQNYSPTGPLVGYFGANNDRKTSLLVFKASHVLPIAGGVELGFKYKRVNDKNNGQISNLTDDRETKDSGYTLSVGNQLFGDLYGYASYGRYSRDIVKSGADVENDKKIASLRFSYNLAGFEAGLLAQWIRGTGDPTEQGAGIGIKQYRMKGTLKAIF